MKYEFVNKHILASLSDLSRGIFLQVSNLLKHLSYNF